MCRIVLACAVFISLCMVSLRAQDSRIRIMEQDSTLNNLMDPPGYVTAEPGTWAESHGLAMEGKQ